MHALQFYFSGRTCPKALQSGLSYIILKRKVVKDIGKSAEKTGSLKAWEPEILKQQQHSCKQAFPLPLSSTHLHPLQKNCSWDSTGSEIKMEEAVGINWVLLM